MKNTWVILLSVGLLVACTTAQIHQTIGAVNDSINGQNALTADQVGKGLKEALVKGISKGSDQVSQLDGYFKNPKIKISGYGSGAIDLLKVLK